MRSEKGDGSKGQKGLPDPRLRFPDQSTLRRFLKRLPPKSIRQLVRLHDSLRAYLFALPHQRNSLVFDVDSTVIIIYGRAEGARVGYNPKKPGRRSYHPLLCFEEGFQEFWHGSLRPGNAGASTGCCALSQGLSGEGSFDDRPLAH